LGDGFAYSASGTSYKNVSGWMGHKAILKNSQKGMVFIVLVKTNPFQL
jgi:hypothetical protein